MIYSSNFRYPLKGGIIKVRLFLDRLNFYKYHIVDMDTSDEHKSEPIQGEPIRSAQGEARLNPSERTLVRADDEAGQTRPTTKKTKTRWTIDNLIYGTNWFKFALSGLSGLLLFISFSPISYGLIGWIALVPLLIAIYISPSYRQAGLCGLLTGVIFYSISLSFLIGVFGFIGFIFANLLSLYLALFSISCWLIAKRIGLNRSFWLIPIFWTGIEFFRSEVYFLKFPWLALGYSQAPYNTLIQVCDIFGVYGLSFLIITVNALVTLFILKRIRKGRWKLVYPIIALVIFIFILVYGSTRKSYLPEHNPLFSEERIPVGVVQKWIGSLDRYLKATLEAVDGNRETLVIWPEAALREILNDHTKRKLIESLVRDKKLYLVFGTIEPTEEEVRFHNYAVVMSPEGEIIGKYAKRIPVQFLETVVRPGDQWGLFDTRLGKLGVLICYEAGFTKISRWLTHRGAEILVIPTLEIEGWAGLSHRLHSTIIPFRAVETRRSILRSTALGYSMIVHPSGKVEGQLGYLASGVIRSEVPKETKLTFYVRYGYHFPKFCLWIYVGCFILWIILLLISRIRAYIPDSDIYSD